jgi:AcrR family transcriptional regulator
MTVMPDTAAGSRRGLILGAAAELFAARGYHEVGVDEVGTRAGITGPGVYRHFSGKQALLEALCDLAMSTLEEGTARAASLEALVDQHVTFAVEQRHLIAVYYREQRALPDEVRHAQRRRQRAYEALWRDVAAPLRPDLAPAEVQLVVVAALAVLNATALSDVAVPAERRRVLLREIALATLLGRAHH